MGKRVVDSKPCRGWVFSRRESIPLIRITRTEASPLLYRGLLVFTAMLALATAALTFHSLRLEQRLTAEQSRLRGITELLQQTEGNFARLEALEARVGAGTRVISNAAQSVIFLQGAYGFVDPDTRKPLRFLGIGPDGRPLRDASGEPFVTPEGTGPIIQKFFTGTAFVASDDGLLVTNRHVAMPWESDAAAQLFIKQGFIPIVQPFVGYLAELNEPFDVQLVAASDKADVAVLRCSGVTGRVRALTLRHSPPQPGDDVIVLGYPTGIRALLARAGESFMEELRSKGNLDFWTTARHLAEQGRIGPLATRGIVGQVSAEAVVYDAETTSGGSGGPVIDINGEVVAINSAILPEFGGSNLGVPAAQVRSLLTRVRTLSG